MNELDGAGADARMKQRVIVLAFTATDTTDIHLRVIHIDCRYPALVRSTDTLQLIISINKPLTPRVCRTTVCY